MNLFLDVYGFSNIFSRSVDFFLFYQEGLPWNKSFDIGEVQFINFFFEGLCFGVVSKTSSASAWFQRLSLVKVFFFFFFFFSFMFYILNL